MHWARLEASALGSLIAACPAWKRRERGGMAPVNQVFTGATFLVTAGALPPRNFDDRPRRPRKVGAYGRAWGPATAQKNK